MQSFKKFTYLILVAGANILVSAFTITVIAIDRWRSVTNTNPVDSLTYKQVAIVIVAIWAISFAGKYKNRGRQADNSFPEDVFVTYPTCKIPLFPHFIAKYLAPVKNRISHNKVLKSYLTGANFCSRRLATHFHLSPKRDQL